jgi:hypothetical protein
MKPEKNIKTTWQGGCSDFPRVNRYDFEEIHKTKKGNRIPQQEQIRISRA